MKLATLISEEFHTVFNELISQRIPIPAAYALNKIHEAVQKELVRYEELRREHLIRYAKRDENGGIVIEEDNVILDPENIDKFVQDMTDLVNMEVDVGSISMNSLGNATLSAKEIAALGGLVN